MLVFSACKTGIMNPCRVSPLLMLRAAKTAAAGTTVDARHRYLHSGQFQVDSTNVMHIAFGSPEFNSVEMCSSSCRSPCRRREEAKMCCVFSSPLMREC